MTKVIVSDMTTFMVMLCAFIVGNTCALLVLFSVGDRPGEADKAQIEEHFSSFGAALFTSINMLFMAENPDMMELSFAPRLATLNYVYYSLVVALIMVNLLIAIMSGSFERVQEESTNAGLYERAAMLVNWELLMGSDSSNNELFPRWLCFYRPRDFCNQTGGDDARGVVNRIGRKLDDDFGELRGKVQALDEQLAAQTRMLQTLLAGSSQRQAALKEEGVQ
eukprot:COSAG06_NODE_573_length_14086_cov_30.835633_9_plen_222_part_00